MKSTLHLPAWPLLLLACMANTAHAQQYDDLYYDPSKATTSSTTIISTTTSPDERGADNVTRPVDSGYDDEFYNGGSDDDYDYEYSSRIRRFHRNSPAGYDYYDPYYVDMWNYDPYYLPGTTIYVVDNDDWYRNRRRDRYYRRHGYNDWGWGPDWGISYNPWVGWNVNFGWGSPYFQRPWYNPYVFNNYYYDPYWSYSGWNSYYCPPGYGWGYNGCGNNWYGNNYNNGHHNGWGNNNGSGYKPATYTGPRRGGVIKTPPPGLVSDTKKPGRITTTDAEPVNINPRSGDEPRRPTISNGPKDAPGRSEIEPQREALPSRQMETGPSRRPSESPSGAEPSRRPSDSRPETAPSRRPETSQPETTPEPSRRNDRKPQSDEPTPSRRRDEATPPERPSRSEQKSSSDDRPRRERSMDNDSPRREPRSESRTESPRTERKSESRSETRSSSPSRSNDGGGSSRSSSPSKSPSGGGGKKGRD